MTDEQIFGRAVELFSGERTKFLDAACETMQQKQRIEAMLAAHDQSDSLLDTDAMKPANDTIVDAEMQKTIGDFTIVRELGRGGMGVVYEAWQKSLRRKVALKVLSSGLGLSSKAILRFRREAEAAGKLHHTNIVPIYTTGEDKGIHYYAIGRQHGVNTGTGHVMIRAIRASSSLASWNAFPNSLCVMLGDNNTGTGHVMIRAIRASSSLASWNAFPDSLCVMLAFADSFQVIGYKLIVAEGTNTGVKPARSHHAGSRQRYQHTVENVRCDARQEANRCQHCLSPSSCPVFVSRLRLCVPRLRP